MPPHYSFLRAAPRLSCELCQRSLSCQSVLSRGFHASRSLHSEEAESTNHYATLGVLPSASAGDIKKSFYKLSKAHHPDHNPTDPTAGYRFMRISEAYSILGDADKRAHYDRDTMRHWPSPVRPASYASTGPVGGRPASGLSRRRGTFKGPPPSFFRSGGWGAHTAKRRAAQNETTGASKVDGMSFGHDHWSRHEDMRHFDHESHERTQRWVEQAAARRRASRHRAPPFFPESGTVGNFLVVTGVLAVAITGPFFVLEALTGIGDGRRKRVVSRL